MRVHLAALIVAAMFARVMSEAHWTTVALLSSSLLGLLRVKFSLDFIRLASTPQLRRQRSEASLNTWALGGIALLGLIKAILHSI